MKISVTEAKAHLLDLVRRAENGEEVVLVRRGEAVAQLVPVRRQSTAEQRREALMAIRGILKSGPSAARSQDFLYDDDGMPK